MQRDVRNFEQEPVEVGLHLAKARVVRLDFLAERARLLDERLAILTPPLATPHLLARDVTLCLEFLDGLEKRSPFLLERLEPREDVVQHVELAAATHSLAKRGKLLADHPEVVHFSSSGRPASDAPETTVRDR